jgi:hypothetical protein
VQLLGVGQQLGTQGELRGMTLSLIIGLVVIAIWALARWTAARPPRVPQLHADWESIARPDDITIRRAHLPRVDPRRVDVRTIEVEWPREKGERRKREAG